MRCALEGLRDGSGHAATLGWTQGGAEARETRVAWSSAPVLMASACFGAEQSKGEGQGGRVRALGGESEGMEAWRSSAYTLEEQGCVAAMVWVPILG